MLQQVISDRLTNGTELKQFNSNIQEQFRYGSGTSDRLA